MNTKPGMVLRNGAVVVAVSGEILLAVIPGNAATPYVTWTFNDNDQDTFWGQYYPSFHQASKSFEARARGE